MTDEHRDVSLERVIEVQTEIAGTDLDLAAVMEVVTHRGCELTGADGAVVELAEGPDMVYRAATGAAAGHLGLHLKREGSLSGLCVASGDILTCADSESDPRVDRDACRRIGLRSMVVVPLKHRGAVVGVLKVYSGETSHFGPADVQVLGLLAGLVGSSISHADQQQAAAARLEEFAHLATHDPLTGLANRALLYDRLRHLIAQAEREQRRTGLLLLDLDGFKEINDERGHAAGDACLRWVAGRLTETVRNPDLAARLGGDEFAVAVGGQSSRDGLDTFRQRVSSRLAGTVEVEGEPVPVMASVGAALYPDDGTEPDALIGAADAAMYEVKRSNGRGRR